MNGGVAASSSASSSTSSATSSGAAGIAQNFKGNRPDDALRIFGAKLTAYEHTEIYNFNRIYFVGSQATKRGGVVGGANNAGYDDENGSYQIVAHDHIVYRYEILKIIGKGSFGQVIKFSLSCLPYILLFLIKISFITEFCLGNQSVRSQISAIRCPKTSPK